MLEDGLKEIKEDKFSTNKDSTTDSIGAQYLKVINHVSFSDAVIYTVEL